MFVKADRLKELQEKHREEASRSKYETLTFREVYRRCQRYLKKADEANVQVSSVKSDEDKRIETIKHIEDFIRDSGYVVDGFEEDVDGLINELTNEFVRYGILTEEIDPNNEDIDEIQVNGKDQIFYTERGNQKLSDKRFGSQAELRKLINRLMSGGVSSRLDKTKPFVNARTAENFRLNVTHPSINPQGEYAFTLRKQKKEPITQKDVLDNGTITKNMLNLMKLFVRGKVSWATVGSTGSGKTVLNNVLLPHMDPGDRSIFIENPTELRPAIRDSSGRIINNFLQLEAKTIDKEKLQETSPTMYNLLVNALRQTPDYIVPGEVRAPNEFDTALSAAQTGHIVFTTYHAEDPEDAIFRYLEAVMKVSSAPPELILRNICSAFKYIINVEKLSDGTRRVMYITEVLGNEGLNVKFNHLYKFVIDKTEYHKDENGRVKTKVHGRHVRLNAISPKFQERLLAKGVPEEEFEMFKEEPKKMRDEEGRAILDRFGNEIVFEEEAEYKGKRPAIDESDLKRRHKERLRKEKLEREGRR